ncbi:hypothetical protein P280DRAFT_228350 [Massarina eburnea CBS 473.64]|uniref:Uncharacterized protein n=1 Tax=Massarina eburnea CBS 473.64 TaxID=1395130 RepID=A0A6A6S934_9PLEO|nr:hypothetical protein P280DRAFT_228350 [Massarina eburnea CBS 473.64]
MLASVSVSSEEYIRKVDDYFELKVEGLYPSNNEGSIFPVHDKMILKTSNAAGSGHEIIEWKEKQSNGVRTPQNTEPVVIYNDQGATWYRTVVDATLPWLPCSLGMNASTLQTIDRCGSLKLRAEYAPAMLRDHQSSRFENFLITFKPGEQLGFYERP